MNTQNEQGDRANYFASNSAQMHTLLPCALLSRPWQYMN